MSSPVNSKPKRERTNPLSCKNEKDGGDYPFIDIFLAVCKDAQKEVKILACIIGVLISIY
jgi:hypothetical protein